MSPDGGTEPVRLDKWLWAARLHKTRALAAEAVKGGRVWVNGARVKPSREVRVGDEVEATLGQTRLTVVVCGLANRRGPAVEAQKLYEETEASRAERERRRELERFAPPPLPVPGARPTKRDRRRYDAGRRRG